MESDIVHTLMGILAIYCDFVSKGLLRDTKGKMPPEQQRAIDDFARATVIAKRREYTTMMTAGMSR